MSKRRKKPQPAEPPVQDRLSDNCHCDQLSDMRYRLWGFHLAITGAAEELGDDDGAGLLQLSRDICEQMDAIHAAFAAEHDLRLAKKLS
jgi:hypothetical protein